MNKNKIYSFIFTATATGVVTFGAWLILVACDRLFLLMGI